MIALCAFFLALGLTAYASPLVHEPAYSSSARGSRIISGWEAADGQFPYQLSLRLVNTEGLMHACGASLIHSEWALSAAHCTAERIRIIVGGGTNSYNRPEFQVETTEYYTHPSFVDSLSAMVQPNDISLIKFASVTFNDRVQPIRIASSADKDKNWSGVRLVASGWGSTVTGGVGTDTLNWVYLRGISNAGCLAAYDFLPLVQDSTLCTIGYNDISQSTCNGDTGSPLVSYEDGTLVGVSSFFSNLGCHVGVPAGFVRANYYHDWYTEVTGIGFEAEEATTVAPEEEDDSSSSPESSSSESSKPSSEESSEDETTEAPEEEATEAPEEEATEAPEEEGTEAPEEENDSSSSSESSSEVSSEVETTEAPEEEVTEGPKEEVTEAPETEDDSSSSSQSSSEESSEVETTVAPEEEVTEASKEDVTEAPEAEDDSSSSSQSSSEESSEVETTEAPEEEVTEAPKEEVTEAPEAEDDSSSSSQSSSEEFFEVETTDAPEEEAAEAPEKEESKKSIDVIGKLKLFFRFRA